MSPGKFFLYSMHLSWYSAKVRPYLRYRRLPFDERTPTPLALADPGMPGEAAAFSNT